MMFTMAHNVRECLKFAASSCRKFAERPLTIKIQILQKRWRERRAPQRPSGARSAADTLSCAQRRSR